MAVLATYDEVQELMQNTSIDSMYITNILITVDRILTKVYEHYTGTISDDLLREIQKYYAAHIIASTTQRMSSEEKVGEAQIKYIGKWDVGFNSTPYGQLLLGLDSSGLIAQSAKKAASIYAVKSFD
ncbi:MAG: hypothetical protein QHH74_11810 [Spirochaetota bacterium]|nr:hypothetical protein [Spirochaetota bacterium]